MRNLLVIILIFLCSNLWAQEEPKLEMRPPISPITVKEPEVQIPTLLPPKLGEELIVPEKPKLPEIVLNFSPLKQDKAFKIGKVFNAQLILENKGEGSLLNAKLELELEQLVLSEKVKTIVTLAPKSLQTLVIPLEVTGTQANNTKITAKLLNTTESLSVFSKSCTKDMFSALRGLEVTHRQSLDQSLKSAKLVNPLLSEMRHVQSPTLNGRQFNEANRLYQILKSRNSIDPAFFTKAVLGENLQRSIYELKAYLNQSQTSGEGICAGVKEFVGFYRKQNSEIYKRSQNYLESVKLIVGEIILEKNSIAELEINPADLEDREKRINVLAQLTEKDVNARLTRLAHMHLWLNEGKERAQMIEKSFEGLMQAILEAQATQCVCE